MYERYARTCETAVRFDQQPESAVELDLAEMLAIIVRKDGPKSHPARATQWI